MFVFPRAARAIALLSLTLIASACIRRQTDPVTGKSDFDLESPFKKGETMKASVAGTSLFPTISGRAEIRTQKSGSSIALTVENLTPGQSYPWHLHDGNCDLGGPIVGDAGAYSPLTAGADGKAQGSATIAIGLNEAARYHINVHRSPSEMATIIACGNVTDK
jgi:hypothetical protein